MSFARQPRGTAHLPPETRSAVSESTGPKPDALLTVRNLQVQFTTAHGAVPAVKGVSFTIGRGETVALVGESGSGKSTTGLALMGLHASGSTVKTGGEFNLRFKDGAVRDLNRLTQRQLRSVRGGEIAMIFQEPMSSLNPIYTIESQIREAIRLHEPMTKAAARARIQDLLASLGVPDPRGTMQRYPHQLSGGMRQRIMIAMALACNPSLLIADEPTTALDVTIQAQILDLLRGIQARTGMSILFITHNLGVVAELAQRVLVMYGGQVVEAGPVEEVFARPRMPYTRALLRSLPRLRGASDERSRLEAIPGAVPSPLHSPSGCYFHPRCALRVPGLCDQTAPGLEECSPDHVVSCHRWREIADGSLT